VRRPNSSAARFPPASATTAWQVAFLVTGEFREFTDASHLEIEHPELLERGGSPT